MSTPSKQDFICRKARENRNPPSGQKIYWSRHGIVELVNEGWEQSYLEQGLQNCQVIEDYPASPRALPDCLVLGWTPAGEPFHAVVAIDVDKDRIFIITVYKPASDEWEYDWRTRKK